MTEQDGQAPADSVVSLLDVVRRYAFSDMWEGRIVPARVTPPGSAARLRGSEA